MNLGTEDAIDSAEKMMKVSDNPATRAQYEHWAPAPATINAFATSLGLTQTQFMNYVGCDSGHPAVDGNTRASPTSGPSTRASQTAPSSAARSATTSTRTCRAASRVEDDGFDFTGIWNVLVAMVEAEKPAGMPNELRDDFVAG